MILDPSLTAAYVVLATALALAPGPDVMFVLANGLRHRARGAMASALGIGAGSLCHAAAAALGISALIATAPAAFDLLRYAGAAYLAYLGLRALGSCWRDGGSRVASAVPTGVSLGRVFRQGMMTNLLNPKMIAFYLALLPQFAAPELGRIGLQIFLLGCIHNLIGTAFLIAIGLAAGQASGWLAATRFGRWMDAVAGLFFLALALRLLAWDRGPG